jgi:hypothetical protein
MSMLLSLACIAIIQGGSAVVLPTDKLTLSWVHTVERTPWEEDYEIRGGALTITEARIKRGGAGMEAPTGAIWSGGWWRYVPPLGPLSEVVLANSSFAAGYKICWPGTCRPLNDLVAIDTPVKLSPVQCRSEAD